MIVNVKYACGHDYIFFGQLIGKAQYQAEHSCEDCEKPGRVWP